MKLIIIKSLLALIISVPVFSQEKNSIDGILFGKQIMGNSLSSVKDSLFCAEIANALYSPVPDTKCHSFRYAFTDRTQVFIGNIFFKSHFIFTDSVQKIDHVSYMNVYTKAKMSDYKKRFIADFKKISKYLARLFGKQGLPGPDHVTKYSSHKNLNWIDNDFTYILTKDENDNKANQTELYIISFMVRQRK